MKTPPTVTQAMNIDTLAARLDVSPWTVRTWLRQGRVPFFKIGRRVLVRVEDVDALLAQSYKAATRPGPGAWSGRIPRPDIAALTSNRRLTKHGGGQDLKGSAGA